jgi:hypothetical protein
LFGATLTGGTDNTGTVFRLSILPRLTILRAWDNVILTWPTNFAGFDFGGYYLQSTTSLVSPSWTTNLETTAISGDQNAVTNPISAAQQFFRLLR